MDESLSSVISYDRQELFSQNFILFFLRTKRRIYGSTKTAPFFLYAYIHSREDYLLTKLLLVHNPIRWKWNHPIDHKCWNDTETQFNQRPNILDLFFFFNWQTRLKKMDTKQEHNIYPTPPPRAKWDTWSIFVWSKDGLNLVFFLLERLPD